MRLTRSLAGSWPFQLDPTGAVSLSALAPDRRITVPLPWQAAFPELQTYSGYAWYAHTFTVDDSWLGGELLLTFGAVDYWCEVFVNGQRIGEHEGGYMPFTFAIRDAVHAGDNQIAVHVYDAAQSAITFPRWPDAPESTEGMKFNPIDIPHGKQEWYLNVGGIWQDVTLTAVSAAWIDHVAITSDLNGNVDLVITLNGQVAPGQISANVGDVRVSIPLIAGQTDYAIRVHVDQPKWWSPDSPELYTATVLIQDDSQAETDSISVRFGFRTIETRDGKLLLNGKPLYLLAVLDQDLYAETIYTVPSEAYLRDEFQKARQLGINCLRCHIKPPDPRYLDLADEMGLLVWTEIPSWRTFHPRTTLQPDTLAVPQEIRARVEDTLTAMIQRDYNHPSIIIWTLVNEDWGTTLAYSPADRAWLSALYDRCKQLDPTRLVVDNSACPSHWGPNVHVKSDLDDFHTYQNIPDNAADFTQFIEQFGLRPLWTYSNFGDIQRSGDEPLILSEFGNWGLPSLKGISPPDGSEPDWFHLGPWWSSWGGEPGWPRGVEKRFSQLGLDAIWSDYEELATATQWHQFNAMKFEIEAMRRQPSIMGYVITELSDIYWESNGLLDFNRNPKVYHDRFAAINVPDVLIPQVKRYAAWSGDRFPVQLETSHYGAADWSNVTLTAQRADDPSGEVTQRTFKHISPAAVTHLGRVTIPLPAVESTQTIALAFDLHDSQQHTLAQNTIDVLILPESARRAAYGGELAVLVREPTSQRKLSASLQKLGYRVDRKLTADSDLIVTNYPTAQSLQRVRDGALMLYLSGSTGPFFWREGRGGTYAGNWITSYNWLRPGIHRRLTIDNPLSLPFSGIAPTGVILGLPVYDSAFHADFLAGQFTGWIQHPALHTVQFNYGRGRVIMTTYALRTALERTTPDPVAIAMFHDLIDYLASGDCQPHLSANYA